MRRVILFCIIAMLSLYGCIGEKPYESVPADLKIEAMGSTCAMMMGMWHWSEKVSIDSSGYGVYEDVVYEDGEYDLGHVERKTFRLSEDELLTLYNSIVESGFFGLEGEHSEEPCIWDGCSTVQITRNSSTKKYTNSGCDIGPFNNAEDLIWNITLNKTA